LPKGVVEGKHLTTALDLAPTLLDYAGGTKSKQMAGRSLRPLIEGKSDGWRETVVVEGGKERAVLFGKWKYVVGYGQEGEKQYRYLYNLETDPGELKDIAPQNPSVLEEGQRRLIKWYSEAGLTLNDGYIIRNKK